MLTVPAITRRVARDVTSDDKFAYHLAKATVRQ